LLITPTKTARIITGTPNFRLEIYSPLNRYTEPQTAVEILSQPENMLGTRNPVRESELEDIGEPITRVGRQVPGTGLSISGSGVKSVAVESFIEQIRAYQV